MNDVTMVFPAGMILALCAVVSVCLVLVATLGFLALPVRATMLWTMALALALVSSWAAMTATSAGLAPSARTIALAPLVGVPALVWSGFRAMRGVRTWAWIGPLISVATVPVLWAVQGVTGGRFALFVFLVFAANFAVILVIELAVVSRAFLRLTVPIIAASLALALIIVTAIVIELATGAATDIDFVHTFLSMTVIIYVICLTATVLSLVATWRAAPSATGIADPVLTLTRFTEITSERLRRVRNRRERTWTFIDLRIDELRKIRSATGEVAVNTVAAHFERTVVSCFPADADIGRGETGQVFVLVSLPSVTARESVRTILKQISHGYTSNPLAVRLTASAGIVSVDPDNANLPQLREQAAEAVEVARAEGGDRWHRVDAFDDA